MECRRVAQGRRLNLRRLIHTQPKTLDANETGENNMGLNRHIKKAENE